MAELQRGICENDTDKGRIKLWNNIKATQKNDDSWFKFLVQECGAEAIIVAAENDHSLYLIDDNGKPVSLTLTLDPGVGLKALICKKYDVGNVRFFSDQLSRGETVTLVDIGANIGLFSRGCIGAFGGQVQAVFAYEPNKKIFPVLESNLAGIERVKLSNSGVAQEGGSAVLLVDDRHHSSSSLLRDSIPDEIYSVSEQSIRLSGASEEAAKWLSVDRPIFYKSDTQGYDEIIATSLGPEFFGQVSAAIMEIFPSDSARDCHEGFADIIDVFPCKAALGKPNDMLSTKEAVSLIESGAAFDLTLWHK